MKNVIYEFLVFFIFADIKMCHFSYVADRLANDEEHQPQHQIQFQPQQQHQQVQQQQQQQIQMQIAAPVEDVDMEAGNNAQAEALAVAPPDADVENIDEMYAKFSVQGTSSSKSTGKKKVVWIHSF